LTGGFHGVIVLDDDSLTCRTPVALGRKKAMFRNPCELVCRTHHIGESLGWLLLSGLVLGCSGQHDEPQAPVHQPSRTQAAPPASDVPDLQRRIEEAKQLSLDRAAKEQKSQSIPDVHKEMEALNDWKNKFRQLKDERFQRTRVLVGQVDKTILAYMNSLPPKERDLSGQIQEQRNNFVTNEVSLPLRPEFRKLGLDYITNRLALERAYLHQFLQLANHPPTSVTPHDIQEARELITSIEKTIAGLEAVQPLLKALPEATQGPNVAQESRPEPQPRPVEKEPMPANLEAAAPVSNNWKVVADPGPPLPSWPDKFPYKELTALHPRLVVYPPGNSAFLLAGVGQTNIQIGSRYENLLVGDIRSGKPIGLIRNVGLIANPIKLPGRPALARDGQLVAYTDTLQHTIRVLYAKTGKPKQQIPIDRVSDSALFFPRPNQLLAIDYIKERGMVWDLDTGKELASFPIEGLDEAAGYVAISPGGRYVALALKDRGGLPDVISLIDLTTGQQAGEIRPGGQSSRAPAKVTALAFSPDGQELGAFVSYHDTVNILSDAQTLTVWKLATGREVTRVSVDRGNRGMLTLQGPEPLQWFPDQKAVLINQQMVTNRVDGKLLDFIEAEGEVDAHYATKVLDDNRVLVATHQQRLIIKTVKRSGNP
jgi:hypothetical protein